MNLVKSQERRVKSQKRALALRSSSGSRLLTLDPRPSRRGLTLIELLITILIISILAGLILGVAAVAGETAREAQTRHVVARLHNLLMEHYDSYKTRRVRLRPQILTGINNDGSLNTAAKKGQARAFARLYALRELILMEVPDRWSDILLTDVPSSPGTATPRFPFYQDVVGMSATGRTSLANVYLRRYFGIANRTNTITGNANTVEEITDNQGAECLYMIITLATGDGEARSLFGESTIGDTDGDGAPEFLDGWDRPINFLRWAPGFDSQIQLNANLFLPLPVSDEWKAAAAKDHDSFDMFRVDPPAFRLVPLIYSAGRDETFGIRLVKPHVVLRGLSEAELSNVPPPDNWRIILPWAQVDDSPSKVFLGTAETDGTATDNVHNHLLGQR
ncbi:MAG: prepilin-type N-terminal cleavage/methylation domain-containing protein [Pirellulales bacterium]